MPNADILQQLMPLEIGGVMAQDMVVEGAALDTAEQRAALLLSEMFPHLAAELLPDWERVLAITPAATDTLEQRRSQVVARLRARGGLSLSYFNALAVSMGFYDPATGLPTITIHENIGGDPFTWGVELPGDVAYYFRSGESCCGEYLSDWQDSVSVLGALFEDLKPAHTVCTLPYTP